MTRSISEREMIDIDRPADGYQNCSSSKIIDTMMN